MDVSDDIWEKDIPGHAGNADDFSGWAIECEKNCGRIVDAGVSVDPEFHLAVRKK
jgi:hypothetical protein